MSKPLFRIEELIEALLKGSPNDPVYLRVGSSTYGIQAIDNGSIRVKAGKDTQDATQVVKTLRRYASGTPKGEDTGIAWRIVGVGGGTAIRSVSYDNGKIVVRTLANEGKKMDAEFESPYAGKGSLFKFGGGSDDALGGFTAKELTQSSAIHGDFDHASLNYSGHQNVAARAEESSPDYDASAYDPLNESATPSGYDPVTFEAPKAKSKKPKEKTYRQKHDAAVSAKISSLMHDFDRTGMVGRSKPANRKAALDQAVAIAYSMTAATYRKSGKRLPKGVKRAEGEHSHPFDAPMGYGPEGSRPFYGNPRRLARDRWGNLRFIRRRKDGTYMDNVDFGRSIQTDRRMKAKTWAPTGFRDQGDGSMDLLTSLMGAEGDWNEEELFYDTGDDDDWEEYRFSVELLDKNGQSRKNLKGFYVYNYSLEAIGKTIEEALDDVRPKIMQLLEEKREQAVESGVALPEIARIERVERLIWGRKAWFVDVKDSQIDSNPLNLPVDIKFNTAMGAEDDDLDARYQFVVEVYDNNGDECYNAGGYFGGFGSTIQQSADSARASIIKNMEREDRRIKKAQSRNKAPRAQATRSVAGARFVTVMEWDDDESDYVEIGADLPADIKFNTALAAESSPDYDASAYDPLSESATPSGYDPVTFGAESGDSVWVLILSTEGMNEMGGVYSSKDKAKQAFTKHLKDLGGDPADVDFDSYKMTDWYDNEDDSSLAYHSIRMYEEKLDSNFEMFGQ